MEAAQRASDNFDVEKLLEEIPSVTCSNLRVSEPDICSSKPDFFHGANSQNGGKLEESLTMAFEEELKDELMAAPSIMSLLDHIDFLDDGSKKTVRKHGSGLDLAAIPVSADAAIGNRTIVTPQSSLYVNQLGGITCDTEITFGPIGFNSYQVLPSPEKLNSDDKTFLHDDVKFVDFNVQKQEKLIDDFCEWKHAIPFSSGVSPVEKCTYSLFQHQKSFYPCVPAPVPEHLHWHNLDRRNWENDSSHTMSQDMFEQHDIYQIQTDTSPSKMCIRRIPNDIEQSKWNPFKHDYVINNKQNDYRYPEVLGRCDQAWTSLYIRKLAASHSLCYQRKNLAEDHYLNKCGKYACPDKILTRSNGLKSLRCRPITSSLLSSPADGLFHISGIEESSFTNFASETIDTECTSVNGVAGRIYDMAKDQKGCRFLQTKVSKGSPEDVKKIFIEIIDHIADLITDPFGNYLVQKLLDVCNGDQRIQILYAITGSVEELFSISCDVHGTRVVQKIVETLRTREEYGMIVSSLKPVIVPLMKHTNGNHVVQRCLHHLPPEYNEFLFDAVVGQCVELATDRQGCCVLQKCMHKQSRGKQQHRLISEIASHALVLSQDQYGNYVVQCILDQCDPCVTAAVVDKLKDNYVQLSLQKYSSNVIEKCLKLARDEKITIIEELINSSQFCQILQDQYGNFVIQQALRETKGSLRSALVNAIKPHVPVLRHSPYGKKIISNPFFRK